MRSSRLVAWLAGIGGIAGVVIACVQLKGSLGADCLKNEDCQSGVCTQLKCAEPGPVLELDSGLDAAVDATTDADVLGCIYTCCADAVRRREGLLSCGIYGDVRQ